MKFKIGDKVRVVAVTTGAKGSIQNWLEEKGIKTGDIYTVESFDECYYMEEMCPHDDMVQVQLYPHEIELARFKYTELAEFMYPNGYKEGEWWILK